MKKNCIVAQSGGPTAAINASLAGVISGILESSFFDEIYGSVHGIEGILNHNLISLSDLFQNNGDAVSRLMTTPAMYLGSCRYRLKSYEETPEIYEQIFQFLEEKEVQAFFYIGGNDSMDTVLKLSQYGAHINSPIQFIGIPKTIDNDLVCTDHTPGYGSAAKYIATTLQEIAYDAYIYPVPSITIVEIMGRDAGWLTAASALARANGMGAPHLIYLPEAPFQTEQFIEDIKNAQKEHRNVIIAVSEGVRDEKGNYISATDTADAFGHNQLSGTGKTLEYLVKEHFSIKVRSVEINVLQRAAAHLTSKTDLEESFEEGKQATLFAQEGKTGIMVTINRTSDAPYQVSYSYAPIGDIANQEKKVPLSWIAENHCDITDALFTYMEPLIQGEPEVAYKKGTPAFLEVPHLMHK